VWLGLAVLLGDASSVAAQRSHRVRSGDSFSRIARRYHVSVWDLALANHSRPNRSLHAGQRLEVPGEGEVYVRPGYSLGRIARNHQVSVAALRRRNRLRPGAHLRIGQRLLLPGYEPPARQATEARDWGAPDEPGVLSLRSARGSDEVLSVRLRDAGGRVPQAGLDRLGVLMRRHEEDARRTPSPRLAMLLSVISDHFGGRTVTIVSGFREARRFTSQASQHVSGQATDIQVEGVSKRTLFDFCRSLGNTGCGYYPRSSFVHVDARDAPMQWVDWSRPGRRPRYGTLRRPYRRSERRRRNRPRVTRRVTLPDAVPMRVEVAGASATGSELELEVASSSPTGPEAEVPGG